MTRKNAGINDRDDASGQQSHRDGNSGMDNRPQGEQPLASPHEPATGKKPAGPTPDQRRADIL